MDQKEKDEIIEKVTEEVRNKLLCEMPHHIEDELIANSTINSIKNHYSKCVSEIQGDSLIYVYISDDYSSQTINGYNNKKVELSLNGGSRNQILITDDGGIPRWEDADFVFRNFRNDLEQIAENPALRQSLDNLIEAYKDFLIVKELSKEVQINQ